MRLALVLLLLPSLAGAQAAQALLDEGTALREQGDDAEALERFERAAQLEPSGQAFAQIALAEQALGRFVRAESHMQDALSHPDDRFVRRHRALLEQALGEITARVGELTITGGVPGAVVQIDGIEMGTMPLAAAVRLVAGTVRVLVNAAGYDGFQAEIEIPAAGSAELDVPMQRTPVAEPEPSPEPIAPATSWAWALPIGAAGAAVGVAGLVVASMLMFLRENDAQARMRCTDTGNPSCQGLFSEALTFEGASIATYVVAGVIALPSLVLIAIGLLTEPHDRRPGMACDPSVLGAVCRF